MYNALSNRALFGRFVSNAVVYGACLIIPRIGWILLLPIYWKKLSPADYGLIGLAQLLQVLLIPALTLGLQDAVQRFYFEWVDSERKRYIAALWIISLTWSVALCGLLLATGSWFFSHIFHQVPFMPHLAIAVVTAFFSAISYFPLSIIRVREQIRFFSIVNVATFATQALASLCFVFIFDLGAVGYLLGVMTSAAIWSIGFVIMMMPHVALPLRGLRLSEPIKYALPTVPVSILDSASNLLDRFFLDKHVSLAQIGLYNLANQFGSAFNLFNVTLKSSWVPFLYRVMAERDDTAKVLARFSIYYLAILALPALAIALLAKELIVILGDTRYQGIYPIVPWFVLAYYIQSAITAMGRGLDLANKTIYAPLSVGAHVATAAIALSLLVPRYGIQGAIASLILAFTVRAAIQIWLAHRFFPRPFPLATLLKLLCVGLLIFALGSQIDTENLALDVLLKCLFVVSGWVMLLCAALGPRAVLSVFLQMKQYLYRRGVEKNGPGTNEGPHE